MKKIVASSKIWWYRVLNGYVSQASNVWLRACSKMVPLTRLIFYRCAWWCMFWVDASIVLVCVCRIDSNVDDATVNIESAHSEILKYFQSVSSSRWLMIKIFAVLIIFFIIFVVFMAWVTSDTCEFADCELYEKQRQKKLGPFELSVIAVCFFWPAYWQQQLGGEHSVGRPGGL